MSKENNYYSTEVENKGVFGISFYVNSPDKNAFKIYVPMPGSHMVLNGLAAVAVGKALGIENEKIKNGIESFMPSEMRMDIKKNDNDVTVVNDVYNSSPTSAKAAIDVLKNAEGRKVCVLGDMLELGEFSDKYHYELGAYASENNIDVIVAVGKASKSIYDGASEFNEDKRLELHYFKEKNDFLCEIKKIVRQKDTVLVKASRGMKFEDITNELLR